MRLLGRSVHDGEPRYSWTLEHIREISLGGYEWSAPRDRSLLSGVIQKFDLPNHSSFTVAAAAYIRTRFWCRLSKNLGKACPNLTRLDLSDCGKT